MPKPTPSHQADVDSVRLLTPDEVADALLTTPRTVRQLRADGRLPAVVFGHRTVRYRLTDVIAFVDSCLDAPVAAANLVVPAHLEP